MKKNVFVMQGITFVVLLAGLMASSPAQARCSRGATAAGFFAGAITGAALSGAYDNRYYYDIPAYDIDYPGIPIFAYDYPTYSYAPIYAPYDTRYTIYPSYYLAY